jgi:hypothetical protein
MRVRLALIPLVAAAALLAGCATANTPATAPTSTGPADNGVSALAPADILAKAQAALAAAKSYHMVGSATENNQKLSLDLKFSGKDVAGTIDLGVAKLEIIGIGNDIYLKAPDDFWSSQIPSGQAQALLALIKGKYVKVDGQSASFSELTDNFKPENLLKPDGDITKGDTKTIDGTPAIALVDKDGSKLYIATTGDPVPLSIEDSASSSSAGASFQFKEYNVPVTVTAPAAADVFDLKALMGN